MAIETYPEEEDRQPRWVGVFGGNHEDRELVRNFFESSGDCVVMYPCSPEKREKCEAAMDASGAVAMNREFYC